MKKNLLFALSLIMSVSTYHAQCDDPVVVSPLSYCSGGTSIPLEAQGADPSSIYTINMFDSFGDGWNAHEITLDVGGVTYGPFGITNAQGGFNSETFTVNEGDLISATWQAGSWASEISFNITDNNGTIVFNGVVDDAINYNVPSFGPYVLTWYDAPGGTLLGTGSPLEAVGTSVMPTSSTGSYSFYVTQTGGACTESASVELVIDIADVNVDLTAVGEACTGTSDGTFSITTVDCGTAPFSFSVDGGAFGAIPTDLAAGTYSVVVQDGATPTPFESNPITVVIGTTDTYIPAAPTATVDEYFICTGDTTQMIEATASGFGTQTAMSGAVNLAIPDSSPVGISSDLIISAVPAGATITDISVTLNITHTYDADLDVTLTGPNATTIELTTDNGSFGDNFVNTVFSNNGVTAITAGAAPFTGTFLPEGDLTTLFSTPNGTWTLNITDDLGGDIGTLNDWTIAISYTLPAITVEWYDMATNGSMEGTGSLFESINTSVLPTPATAGTYEFYAGALAGGCSSVDRTLVTVNVNDVNVELTSVDASCNGSAIGSFEISDTICGLAPFIVSVDGGAFGPIPTDLLAGNYSVIVQDDNGDNSAAYILVVGEADTPTGSYMEDITDNGGQVSWNANGNETEWNVEWGLPGFTPGTGTEIGSTQAMDTFAIITGLDGNTNYDVYVSANCGGTSVTGGWDMVNWTTDCGIYILPFEETFEDDSETRVCWYNINEVGTDNWTYQTGSSGGVVNTAFEGSLNARYVSANATSTAKLASPRIDISSQDSVAIIFAYAQESWFGSQNITKVYKRGSDTLPWIEIASYNVNTPEWTLDTLYVADSSDQLEIAFEGTNNWGRANVVDAVEVLPCSLEPGIDGSDNVCRAVETVDLNSFITAGESFGTWSFPANESFVTGSIASVQFLPEGTHDFYYIVKTPCASDTTIATLIIYGPSSAGNDGADTVCMNEPYNLLSSLSGSIDLGGDWIDPTGASLASPSITGSSIPGSYNYQYVTSNGVCDADTSTVLLFVNPDCDYLGLMEADLGFFELYPNPTNGAFSIQANDADGFFSVEITDLNGRIVSTLKNFITANEIKSVDLSLSENGVYFVKIYNNNVFKTYRVVKN